MIKPSTQKQFKRLLVLIERMTLKQAAHRIHISYQSARQIVSRCQRDRRGQIRGNDRRIEQRNIPVENSVKFNRWIRYAPEEISQAKDMGGCYVFYGDGIPRYIGQSERVKTRIRTHYLRKTFQSEYSTAWGVFKSLWIKVKYHKKYGEWAACEARLIKRIKPPHNKRGLQMLSRNVTQKD